MSKYYHNHGSNKDIKSLISHTKIVYRFV